MPKRISTTEAESPNKAQKLNTPTTKDAFLSDAAPLPLKIGDVLELDLKPIVFLTGSCGWGYAGKFLMPCGSDELPVQCNVNMTLNGSKEWTGGADFVKDKPETQNFDAVEYLKSKFMRDAQTFDVTIGPLKASLKPKHFSTGAVGWFASTRGKVSFGEFCCMAMVSINATVLKSKEWADEDEESYEGDETEETDDDEESEDSDEE